MKAAVLRREVRRDGADGLERWEYGNPEQVAARRQAQSCHGCRHEQAIQLASECITYCAKGRKHGRRCPSYQRKEQGK